MFRELPLALRSAVNEVRRHACEIAHPATSEGNRSATTTVTLQILLLISPGSLAVDARRLSVKTSSSGFSAARQRTRCVVWCALSGPSDQSALSVHFINLLFSSSAPAAALTGMCRLLLAFSRLPQVGRLRPERMQMLHNVFHQGDPADAIYIVASGALKARQGRKQRKGLFVSPLVVPVAGLSTFLRFRTFRPPHR